MPTRWTGRGFGVHGRSTRCGCAARSAAGGSQRRALGSAAPASFDVCPVVSVLARQAIQPGRPDASGNSCSRCSMTRLNVLLVAVALNAPCPAIRARSASAPGALRRRWPRRDPADTGAQDVRRGKPGGWASRYGQRGATGCRLTSGRDSRSGRVEQLDGSGAATLRGPYVVE